MSETKKSKQGTALTGAAAKAVPIKKAPAASTMSIQTGSMKLEDVINPNRQNSSNYDVFLVENPNDTPPDRLVASGGQIKPDDAIICEADASARVAALNASSEEVDIASFANDNPASVEVNWDEVVQVDEYYNGDGYTYDISLDDGSGTVVVTIVG